MRKTKNIGKTLIIGGAILLAAAMLLAIYNIYDENRAKRASDNILTEMAEVLESPKDPTENTDPPPENTLPVSTLPVMETVEIDENQYIGKIDIPVLNLTLPVMSEWSYRRLRTAPCRYTGTVFDGSLTIAAHNYPSHFGRLKDLYIGDEVSFTDMDGYEWKYTVQEVLVLMPTAIDEMTKGDDWDLTLFTCTYGGRTRLAVRCVRMSE
ncbi:sortase [Christensenellaceae bacterium OttesenSCG-928-L17]|nr:sortase [Christensenellaceae bacterium OttesenSCG-928-L17]